MFVIRVYYNSYAKLYYNISMCSIDCNTCTLECEGQIMYSHCGIREWIISLQPVLYNTKSRNNEQF